MPIPINPDLRTRATYVANVIDVWNSATIDQHSRGRGWYQTAHQLAHMIADGNVRMGAGVIAALSANKRWETNVNLATQAFRNGTPTGHFNDALSKAQRIMDGEDPESVLPMGIKTGQFFRCITNPSDPDAVCIDRHAHDIAVGVKYGNESRGLSSRGRYTMLADIYRSAASRLGEIPLAVQATTWVVWIERN